MVEVGVRSAPSAWRGRCSWAELEARRGSVRMAMRLETAGTMRSMSSWVRSAGDQALRAQPGSEMRAQRIRSEAARTPAGMARVLSLKLTLWLASVRGGVNQFEMASSTSRQVSRRLRKRRFGCWCR
jgi:hypothetical protein